MEGEGFVFINTSMVINTEKYRLPKDKYFQEEHKKDLIVLHFTAGNNASGAFNSWVTSTTRVSTPFIVDLDGTVYQVYDPKYWSYHLGIKGPFAQNWRHDKRSIAIEVVNFGPLKRKEDKLYAWPKEYTTFFCNISEQSKYVAKKYRGFDYYAAFTPQQLTVIPKLVKYLTDTFKINHVIPDTTKREEFDLPFFSEWKGIASHQNYRPDKFDIGPAFNWETLLQ